MPIHTDVKKDIWRKPLRILLVSSVLSFALIPSLALAQATLPPPIPSEVAANPDMALDPDLLEEFEYLKQERLQQIKERAHDEALDRATTSFLPMEDDEIKDFMTRLRTTQEAIQKPVYRPPTPDIQVEDMKLDPSAMPPVIMLAPDNVTSLTILDITGEPWPIVDIGFGGPYDVKPPEPGGHVIRITPLKEFASGNMSVRLLDFSTPLTFTLTTGGDTVHYRFDARVPEYGPNADMPIISGGGLNIVAGDQVVTGILEGVPPSDAERLITTGTDGRTTAYRMAGNVYVRTPHTMLSPTWQGSASSSDGMNVYVINDAPVVILSDNGDMTRVRLEREEPRYGE